MRYNRLDLNLLPALRALLTEKSVTRASELLHVTQPAMSRMLARLREYFDDPLIVPMGRRMALTPLAEGLLGKVNNLLLQVDTTIATPPQFEPSRSVRQYAIVASDYITNVLLLDVVRDASRLAPGVSIELLQPAASSPAALDAGDVDFLITPDTYSSPTQSSAVLFDDTYHALVDQAHPGVGDALTLDQYMAFGHVTFRNRGWPLLESFVSTASAQVSPSVVCLNTFELMAPMLIGTERIAIMQSRMAMRMAQVLPVRMVPLRFEMPRLQVVLQWHTYRNADPASVWLKELIVAHAARLPSLSATAPRP